MKDEIPKIEAMKRDPKKGLLNGVSVSKDYIFVVVFSIYFNAWTFCCWVQHYLFILIVVKKTYL